MGLVLSRLRLTDNKARVSPPLDLPADAYTCILEFFLDMKMTNDEHVKSILYFRLINKSTRLAFDKMNGWNCLLKMYQRRVQLLAKKMDMLQATIANPPPLECILQLDAYLTRCWTLQKELSLQRNALDKIGRAHV